MSDFIVFGIRRGGTHAIAQWILQQIKGGAKYYHPVVSFHKENIQTDIYGDGENKYIGFENLRISEFNTDKEEWVNKFELGDMKTIMILRNPWNQMASHIQWRPESSPDRRNYVIELISDFQDDYLTGIKDIDFIIYDKWFQDINYRKQISSQLGLEFSDEGLQIVFGAGGGSSFNGIEYDGKAQEMDVLNRYKQVDNDLMNEFKKSEIGQQLKNKWNHICDLEEINELKIK